MNHALEQEKETLVERNARLTRQLFDKAEEVSRLNAEINGMIETNGKLKRDLNMESVQYYDTDLSWEQVADKLNYSVSRVFQIRKKALSKVLNRNSLKI